MPPKTVDLYHREFGVPVSPALVILHGLLGSSRNWLGAARALGDLFHVFALDLRNHGKSPHTDEHTMALMRGDVLRWLDHHSLDRTHLLGHSMGGKLAMKMACSTPERVCSLTVVDIAPRGYPTISRELDAMRGLETGSLSSRSQGGKRLARDIEDDSARQFLLTNLVRDPGGGFRWQANLIALARSLEDMRGSPLEEGETFHGPTQFIIGELSPFVRREDYPVIERHFPGVEIRVLDGCGHNPHFDDRDRFVEEVARFARDSRSAD